MEKTLDLLALLTCCFIFPEAKNKSQSFHPKTAYGYAQRTFCSKERIKKKS